MHSAQRVVSVDVSDGGYALVQESDAANFTALTTLTANGNSLNLSDVQCFPALEELHLQCCEIQELDPEISFQYLTV